VVLILIDCVLPIYIHISTIGFLRTRPLATSAPPIRAGYDVLLQENAKNVSTKNGARKKAEDPWSQVDDLAEELEDLRKQIEKGTTTARESCNNQITEEVRFLSLHTI
jgi:hypothetical protein